MKPLATSRDAAPRLSVSIITRNEALRLPQFLNRLEGLECEVVLLDTGSTDDTVALARSGNCRIHHFPWCDDFSAARNAALAQCRGDWVLSLDADEYLDRDDFDAIDGLVQGPQDRCYRFTTRNYSTDVSASGFVATPPGAPHSAGFPGWFPSTKVRLFPNIPGVGFEGAVHEMIGPSLAQKGLAIIDTPIPVHHHPLLHRSPEEHREKQEFYLRLGLKKVRESPSAPVAHKELGDQYVDLGRLAEALPCYREAVRLAPGDPVFLRDLGAVLLLLDKVPQAIQAIELSLRTAPDSGEAWRNLGIARIRQEDWTRARIAFERAIATEPKHPEARRYLAIALHAGGDTPGAIALLRQLLDEHPGHGEATQLLDRLRAAAEPEGVLEQ